MNAILDIIAKPGLSSNLSNTLQSFQEPEDNIRNELVKRYGITRARSDNPYERFDVQNFYSDLDDGFTSEVSFNLLNKPLGQTQPKEMLPRHLMIESLSPFRDYSPKGTPGKGQMMISKAGKMMGGVSPGELNEEFVHERIELRNLLLVNRELKGPTAKYISPALLQEMIDAFLLCGDQNFAINVAETLYSKVKLDDLAFLSTYATHYYSHSLNALTCELIDSIFSRFDKDRYQSELTTTSLPGSITRIGYKYTQEVLMFNALSEQAAMGKLAKRILSDDFISRDSRISEGEYVLITSLAGTSIGTIPTTAASSPLCEYINSIGNMTFQVNSASNKGLKSFYSLVSDNGCPLEFAMIGYVKEITKELGVKLFVLPTEAESAALGEKTRNWRITRLCNKSYYTRCEEALKTFCSKTCLSSVLQQLILAPPTVSKQLMQELGSALVDKEIKEHQVNTNLNAFQQKALKASTSQVITIIQGPSGSGKTTAAVEITMEWLRQAPGVILVCSSNQMSVDTLYQEMLRAGIRAVRAGTGEDEVWDMHYQLKGKLFGNPKAAPEGFRAADVHFMSLRKILWDSSVICTTLAGVTSDFLQNMKFNRVIVDDATVATEVSLLMSLTRNCQQLVLIGDIKQLPPTVKSPLARSKGMAMNLVQTLMKKGVRSFVFPVQYKMHSSLYELPSSLFYNSMIKNGIDDSLLEPISSFPWPNPNIRLAILNVDGKEQLVTTSFLNMK